MCPIGRKSHRDRTPEYVTANPPRTTAPPPMAGTMPHQSHLPGPAPHTAGPHRHDIVNKLDPTVDSQSGGIQILGPGVHAPAHSTAHGQEYPHHAPTSTVGQPLHPGGGAQQSTMQPGVGYGYGQPQHNSRLANAIDPRVDTTTAHGPGHTFPAGSQPPPMMTSGHPAAAPQGAYGPHSSRMGNTMDPRIDSDLDGRGRMDTHGHHSQFNRPGELIHPGPAPNTAGPHRSDLLNKLDPTVHSKDVVEPEPARQYRTGY